MRISSGLLSLACIVSRQLSLCSCLAFTSLLAFDSARAISFDLLTTEQTTQSTPASGIVSSTVTASTGILGGSRFVQSSSNGVNRVSADVNASLRWYFHSQDAGTTGSTFIRWDGNPSSTLQPDGLRGLDLTKDGATGIKIAVQTSDSAFGQPITVTFRLFDSTDSTGFFKASIGSLTVNAGITSRTDFVIPFANFTATGISGVDFKSIGAIEMIINGNSSDSHDMAMSFVGTNGNCPHVPQLQPNNQYLILDLCDVCNGNNSTCSDCLGVPNGPALPGVMCPSGQPGICSDGTWTGTPPNSCTCTPDQTPKIEICDQLDNNCDGFVDEGFDKGVSCTVGLGACVNTGVNICAPNGTKICSVAPKAPSSEICDNIDNNCNGQTDEGAPKTGPLVDQCGICKGNGTSCVDCKGTVNGTAKTDDCGVCGGDSRSCLSCVDKDQSETLGELDSGAKEQQIIVRRATSILRSIPQARKEATFISQTLEQAQKLQIENWELSWSLPVIAKTCSTSTSVCTTSSNGTILSDYRANNDSLRDLAFSVMDRVKNYRSGKRLTSQDRKINSAAKKQHQANLDLSRTVPEQQFSCS